ncbi:MAG: DUF305 domain-containing protein [Chitinophagales bacterium]|nr:DUF305 domain-containing protein [Chitinophagales bacterium]
MGKQVYLKFLGSLAASFIIMYGIMFLNVDEASHIYLSASRLYMTMLMTSSMAIVMLISMHTMYKNKRLNYIIGLCSCLLFITALLFLRHQNFVKDRQYMQGMISHHSSAILTSKHANIKDKEVRQLADSIVQSQQREIEQMKTILQRLK